MSDPLASSPLGWKRAGVDRVQITHNGRPVSVVRAKHVKADVDRLLKAGEAEGQQILARLLPKGRRGKR